MPHSLWNLAQLSLACFPLFISFLVILFPDWRWKTHRKKSGFKRILLKELECFQCVLRCLEHLVNFKHPVLVILPDFQMCSNWEKLSKYTFQPHVSAVDRYILEDVFEISWDLVFDRRNNEVENILFLLVIIVKLNSIHGGHYIWFYVMCTYPIIVTYAFSEHIFIEAHSINIKEKKDLLWERQEAMGVMLWISPAEKGP